MCKIQLRTKDFGARAFGSILRRKSYAPRTLEQKSSNVGKKAVLKVL